MFESPVIDLAILLSLTYFVASLLLSAINETLVNGFLRLRQTNLKTAFENLLLGKSDAERDAWKKFV